MTEKNIQHEQFKCENCGGNLVFSPIEQSLKCENCHFLYNTVKEKCETKHDYKLTDDKSSNYNEWINTNKIFLCKNCGSKIILNQFEMSKVCAYCHSPYIVKNDELPGLAPDSIIPFQLDDDMASLKFATYAKKRFLVPSAFKKKLPNKEIKKFYIPVFIFDADSTSSYSGVLKTKSPTTEDVVSENIYGTYYDQHRNIIIETSSLISQSKLQGISPYDFNGLVKYNNSFISGYSVEYYANALKDCKCMADNIMQSSIKSKILMKYDYDSVEKFNLHCDFFNEKYSYNILPVYKFDFDYKNKKYSCLMNGQTGKLGGGLPISIAKVFGIIGIVLLSILVVFGIYWFVV